MSIINSLLGSFFSGSKNKDTLGRILDNFGSLNGSGSFVSRSFDSSNNNAIDWQSALTNILNAYQTSALQMERESVLSQQQFQTEQADLAWQRSQQSAREQMEFQEKQADLAWQRSLESANAQMAFQEAQQLKAMEFNERMSSTAYQRAVKDLKSAGLNPILAVSQGSASSPTVSIPSGASASAQAMSGASASAQAMSGAKGDYSKAKDADIAYSIGSLMTSAGKLIKMLF